MSSCVLYHRDWLLCVADCNESVGISRELAGEDWIHSGTGQLSAVLG